MYLREALLKKKNVFFRALPELPLPQIWATCTTFLDVKNDVLARITEPSNDDYDNAQCVHAGLRFPCIQNCPVFATGE